MNEQDTRAGQCNYPEDRDYRQQKDNGKKTKAFGDEIQEWKRRRRGWGRQVLRYMSSLAILNRKLQS